ncbi:hypothetical protein A2U01_0078843, partial [Trifolium medium]|nr:hypothetical protein [Trifolium medium]
RGCGHCGMVKQTEVLSGKPLLENGEDVVRQERVNLVMLGEGYKNGGYLEG